MWFYQLKMSIIPLSADASIRKTPHWCAAPNKHCIARWGRDSNSWYPYEYGSLANCWFQPLTHPTGGLYTEVTCKSDCKDTVIFEKRAIFLSL